MTSVQLTPMESLPLAELTMPTKVQELQKRDYEIPLPNDKVLKLKAIEQKNVWYTSTLKTEEWCITLHKDRSNCGRAHIHCLRKTLRGGYEKVFEELFHCLICKFGLPTYYGHMTKSVVTMSGNSESRVIEFAKWCHKHHPDYIALNPIAVTNRNSDNYIYEATFYPLKGKFEADWTNSPFDEDEE